MRFLTILLAIFITNSSVSYSKNEEKKWGSLIVSIKESRIQDNHASVVLFFKNTTDKGENISSLLHFETVGDEGDPGKLDLMRTNCDGTVPPKGIFKCTITYNFPQSIKNITLKVGAGVMTDEVYFKVVKSSEKENMTANKIKLPFAIKWNFSEEQIATKLKNANFVKINTNNIKKLGPEYVLKYLGEMENEAVSLRVEGMGHELLAMEIQFNKPITRKNMEHWKNIYKHIKAKNTTLYGDPVFDGMDENISFEELHKDRKATAWKLSDGVLVIKITNDVSNVISSGSDTPPDSIGENDLRLAVVYFSKPIYNLLNTIQGDVYGRL